MIIDDVFLEACQDQLAVSVWVPPFPVVVLGRSNPESEVHSSYCTRADIPVLRRYGGGGTVILYPGCVIVSIGAWMMENFQNDRYFHYINSTINSLIDPKGELSLGQDGISDLVCQGKKFGGTSLFRSKRYLLYQASLIVNLDIDLIEASLPHPSREPGYRQGKCHAEFLTGLAERNPFMDIPLLVHRLRTGLPEKLRECLVSDLGKPDHKHFPHLWRRAEQGRQGANGEICRELGLRIRAGLCPG